MSPVRVSKAARRPGTTEYYLIKPCLAASVRCVTLAGGDELKSHRLCGYEQLRQEVIMRKAIAVFATTALITVLVGIWMRFAPVATEAVTASRVQPSTGAISPSELMSRSSKALPSQYYSDPF
jgi:hypothetical protein